MSRLLLMGDGYSIDRRGNSVPLSVYRYCFKILIPGEVILGIKFFR